MSEIEPYWAIVEIMGHDRIAGRVTEFNRGASAFILVEVPAGDGHEAYAKEYSAAAIFSLLRTTEVKAQAAADYCERLRAPTYRNPLAVGYDPRDDELRDDEEVYPIGELDEFDQRRI